MSMPPDPQDPPSPWPDSHIPSSKAPASSAPVIDPFDTPLFNRLIGLIEELSATVREQKIALEEQNVIGNEQRRVLEQQREVMEDMRSALRGHRNTSYGAESVGTQDDDNVPRNAVNASADIHSTEPLPESTSTNPELGPAALPSNVATESRQNPTPVETPGGDAQQAVGETAAHVGVEEAAAPPIPDSPQDPIHSAILILNETMKSVKETLLDHGTKLNVLIRDALKDDQPYDEKPVEDESTCTALFEIAMARTKEEVDEWIKRMDVSLVFIALFSAVLTAFVVPATQNLFPSSNNTPGNPTDSPPPVPNASAQDVCILYYLALIVAILNAVLSVLGRQWMSKLTTRPVGSTYKERLLRHLAREELAKRWLGYLVEGLHILLLWSIGLFMTGLLYQILNLSGSFERSTPRIFAAWVLGIILSSSIMVVVLAATTHALVYEVSPFGGPFSKVLFKSARVLSVSFDWLEYKVDKIAAWLDRRIKSIPFYRILPAGCKIIAWPLWLCALLVDDWRIDLDQGDREKLVGAFMDLIAEASDPKLLERAVGSFSYVEWFEDGEGTADQLAKTWNRLTATDTSIRVRETLRARMTQFVKDQNEKSKEITPKQIQVLASVCPLADRFIAEVYYASFRADNTDLRPLALLPLEECVARVLCSYNHEGKLGDRQTIFHLAEKHCHDLLEEGKGDDVTRILSHVNRLDLLKTHIQFPYVIYSDVVEFIVKDRKHEILRGINEFVKMVDQSRLGPRSLSQVFLVLASPPPTDIDLCPLIDYISRHPYNLTWKETSDTIIAYLTSFGVSQFSDSTAVLRFLEQCVDNPFLDVDNHLCFNSDDTRAHARDLLAELDHLIRLSSPATGAIASTSKQPASASRSASHTSPPNDASQPDRPLISPAHSLSPAPEDINADPATFANSDSDIPMLTLTPPPHMIASSESESDPPFPSDSRAVFAQSPALENARK
ncbi:hypothetical protein SISNIDRAFT_489875 [Sistotremastrum niveocremeum HHB9708]|uniref:DUF6535 domain-containing protein n=1 Tax=Sistotremastrum niveocremeum HHB9708 TaxID=1314777 RepID=A0A164PE18_9AGAM|nr:hypothetical protein SISNIDRAFT_489875 [Sistotremastrum niveocremeum HHB9708]